MNHDPSFFQFEQTYRNCCGIPHWISSAFICTVSFMINITMCILCGAFPNLVVELYKVTSYSYKIVICGLIVSIILIGANIILAIGIAKDWPVFLMIWVIIDAIIWNLHLILFLHSFVFYILSEHKRRLGPLRLFMLFLNQVYWMVTIVLVAQHWYALCEDMFVLENGTRSGPSTRRRIMAQSIRRWIN